VGGLTGNGEKASPCLKGYEDTGRRRRPPTVGGEGKKVETGGKISGFELRPLQASNCLGPSQSLQRAEYLQLIKKTEKVRP